jgi:hypothetical protein
MFGTTFKGAQIIQSPASDNADQLITRSFELAVAVPLVVLILLLVSEADIVGSVILVAVSAYIAWACYWGIVGVFKFIGGRRTAAKIGHFFERHSFLERMARSFLTDPANGLGPGGTVALTVVIGMAYGILGGCVYEFMRCRGVAQNPALDPLDAGG